MKHKIIFIAAALAFIATGCDKFLDVHPKGEKINMFETHEPDFHLLRLPLRRACRRRDDHQRRHVHKE